MTANDRVENARAAKEARDAVAGRRGGSRTTAAEDALKRYLASESFREHRREEQEVEAAAAGEDEPEQ